MGEKLNLNTAEEDQGRTTSARTWWIIRFFSETKATDWAITFLTGGLLLVGYWQWEAISGQLEEMRKGGADTHELAVQAKNQADRTKDLASLSEKSLRIDQRAWISYTVQSFPNPGVAPVDQPFFVHFEFKNSGRTPARNVKACYAYTFLSRETIPDFKCPKIGDIGNIFPQGSSYSDLLVSPKFDKSDRDKILDGSYRLWVYGRVQYSDVFGVDHWLQFCNHLLSGGGYQICEQHHEIDTN
jgi:hypothetical protein